MTKTANKPKSTDSRIADNKKALFNYAIEERFEAGVVLQGWEVKALRQGKVQLTDGYVVIREGELFLIGCQINPLRTASTHVNAEAQRTKKLLLHKAEIRKLKAQVQQKGYTLIPLSVYLKDGRMKLELGVCRGKQLHDKRDDLADRDAKRDMERAMRHQGRDSGD